MPPDTGAEPPESPDSRSLGEILAAYELEGYHGQMAARPAARILCISCHMESDAEEMQVDALQRVEGVSDPSEMLAVAALICPLCNTQGTIVLGYGPEADPDDADVLAALRDLAV